MSGEEERSSPALDTTRVYRLADRLMLKEDGDVLLAFDPETLVVHQLNSSLAAVVKMCDGECENEGIVLAFAERHGLEIDDASREVYRALKILRSKSLIEACE